MSQADNDFSTQKITPQLIAQVVDALRNKAFGSVEIYIQNYNVVQITERTITKVTKTTIQKTQGIVKNGHKQQFSQSPHGPTISNSTNS